MATRTRNELIKALTHVGYELAMTAAVLRRLAQLGHSSGVSPDKVATNAYLESMLLHLRSLTDFFVRIRGQSTDIHRDDFLQGWQPAPAAEVRRAAGRYKALNKHLSHLTWERVAAGNQQWDVLAALTDIVHIADDWSKHLDVSNHDLYLVIRPFVNDALQVVQHLSRPPVIKVVTTTN